LITCGIIYLFNKIINKWLILITCGISYIYKGIYEGCSTLAKNGLFKNMSIIFFSSVLSFHMWWKWRVTIISLRSFLLCIFHQFFLYPYCRAGIKGYRSTVVRMVSNKWRKAESWEAFDRPQPRDHVRSKDDKAAETV